MSSYRSKQGSYIEILRAVEMGLLKGNGPLDNKLRDYYIRTLIRGGCPASLILDPGRTSRNFNEDDDTLKLYLPFDETSGVTAHDLSGNGNTGTVTGTTIDDGVFGKARNFDGVDDYVNCGSDASLSITSAITLEAWVKLDTWPASDMSATIIMKPYTSHVDPYYDYALRVDDSGKAALTVVVGSWGGAELLGGSVSTGNWHHLVGTFDGTNMRLYIDHGLIDTLSNPGSINSSGMDLNIGRRGTLDDSFSDGLIDEVRIYSRALTADEIYLHYLAGALKLGLI